jgi:hypothetical protein
MWAQIETKTVQKNAQCASVSQFTGSEPAATRPALNTPWLWSSHFQIKATTTGDNSTG